MMESIEKLRESLKACTSKAGIEPNRFDTYWITTRACDMLIDEIEREIAERYMELPVDADGVPVRPREEVSTGMGDDGPIGHLEYWFPNHWVAVIEYKPGQFTRYDPAVLRHVKPRTLEDVLREMLDRNSDGVGLREFNRDFNALVEHYAAEIRELMEASE